MLHQTIVPLAEVVERRKYWQRKRYANAARIARKHGKLAMQLKLEQLQHCGWPAHNITRCAARYALRRYRTTLAFYLA